ncbi:hypothetical protein AAG570_012235 [Ranatra chinensis]|uniref:Small subunit processome component 20 homolog n=1 Tax=Ranatra chinensis TaxID=642074 RepID=A0ABD0YI73_9HEMI
MELWLNPKIHGSVYNTIMDIVERLLTLHRVPEEGESLTELPVNHMTAIDEEIIKDIKEELNFGSKLLIPFIPQILERLKQKLLTGSKQGLVKRDLEVMSRITELVSNSESSELMLNLLLPILHKKGNGSEYVVTPLLTTVFNLMRNISMPERYIKNLAPLFCKVNGVGNRKLLSEIVAELSKNGGSDSGLDINLLEDLNALDTKWVDQPDFNRRLDAFKKLEILLADHKVSVNMGVIVIYTCIYFLHTEKDLSLKDNASYCLKKLCPALCLEYRNNSLEKNYLVNEVILCLLKDGIKDKRNEFIRNESIALLGCMARECGELHPVLRDLSLLGNNTDLEVDFFENLQHLQLHRKVRAMLKFCELAKTLDKPPNTRTLTQFILPLVSYFLCSEKYTNKNTIIDASIQVLGTVCRLLPWHQYSTILSYYLGKLRSSFEYQKQLVRITVEILNSFHFDISQASLKKDESITVEDSSDVASNGCMDVHSGEKEDTSGTEVKHLLDVSEENSAEIELEEKLNAQDNEGTVEEIQTSSLKAIEKTTVLTRAGAVRVMQTITKNFLPSLNKSMAQRTQAETTHKLNRKLIGPDKDEEDILKVPLAIAAVKLLQKLPEGILDRNLPGILMKLCTFLKSRLDSVRRITRETLQTIMISIGPRYLSTLLGEMKALLTRGFHIHVLIYSIHSVLVALKPFFKEGDIGAVMPVLLNVCMMDLFGDTAEEKEVVQITGKTMEARANRAFDIFNIMATYISEGCLLDLILPLKEQMSKTLSHKNITKTSNCLQQVVLGLMDNKYIPVESLLEFAFGTSTESIPVLVSRLDEKPADPKIQELESRKQADTFLIPEEPKRQKAIESKTCVRTNAHILVEFGLRLIYFVLKREKLKNMDYKLYLDPLVQLFSNCLKSQHVKAVAVLVRDVKYYIIEKKHMRALLLYCEQDLDDNSRRATAFSLLKAIVGRKIKTPELHEIILKVAKLSITSNTDAVRLQARQEILQEQSGVILINVGARLVNDEEPGCRKKAADIISSMLLRINYNTANKVFNIVELWMKDNKVALRRLAAQIVGIFVTCEKEKFEARLPVVLPLVVKQISDGSRDNQPGKFVRINSEPENDDMSSDDRLQDHHLYQILQMLIKVCSLCPKVLTDKKYTDDLEIIADNAHSLLAHPHEWVRFSSIQLLGLIVSKVPVADILAVANCESDETAGYLLNNTRYRLRTLVLDLSSQLFPGEFANEKFLMQCMKLLVCLADILKDVKDVENDDGLSLPWMVRRIRKQINIEITQAPTSTIVRTMCFNWIAAVALKFDKDELTSIVYHLMSPLVREINSVDESSSNLRQVAKEAANYIKKKIGSEEYNTLVLNLTTKLDIKRSERRNQRAQLVSCLYCIKLINL